LECVFFFPSLKQSRLKSNRIQFACSIGLSHASPNFGIVLNLTLVTQQKKEHFNDTIHGRVLKI
jgi:hypothetical protein